MDGVSIVRSKLDEALYHREPIPTTTTTTTTETTNTDTPPVDADTTNNEDATTQNDTLTTEVVVEKPVDGQDSSSVAVTSS